MIADQQFCKGICNGLSVQVFLLIDSVAVK